MLSKRKGIFFIGVLLFLILPMVACSKAEPETLGETLARAASVTMVKYELTWAPGSSQVTKVWVKGSKWRIELPPQVPPPVPVTPNMPGGIVSSRVAQGYFVDTEAKTVSIWYTPGNVVEAAIYDTVGNVVEFASAMKWASFVATSNPKLVGTETVDGKSSLVVEFAKGPWTGKAWIWKEKSFLLRMEMTAGERKVIVEPKNIDFSNIPDSLFEPQPSSEAVTTPIRTSTETVLVKDASSAIAFKVSPDARQIAYVRKDGDKQLVVLGDSEGKRYDEVFWGTLTFSPDGKRLAYNARLDGKALVVVDGKESELYTAIRDFQFRIPVFSPDSAHVAHIGVRDGKWFMVADGKAGKLYDGVVNPVFSPDGKRFAYAAISGDKWFMVMDGQEGKQYDAAGFPVFSPDNQRLAYYAKSGNKWFMVLDGKESESYDIPADASTFFPLAVFSPNSKRIAHVGTRGNKRFIVLDGKEPGKQYDVVGIPVFSPDSKRLAYIAGAGDRAFVVLDEKEGKQYEGVGHLLVFSPDSKRLAYDAWNGSTNRFVVADDREIRVENRETLGDLVFSPDSKRLTYTRGIVSTSDRWLLVVVDGVEGKRYNAETLEYVRNPVFVLKSKIIFDSPDSFHYIVQEGKKVLLVEEKIQQ